MAQYEARGHPTLSALMAIVLLGMLLIIAAFFFPSSSQVFVVTLAIGSSLIAGVVVVIAERLIPQKDQRIQFLRGNPAIYREFERMLDALDTNEPHVIRTINSFLPEPNIEDRWDCRVAGFLKCSPQSSFIRIIFHQDLEEWRQRILRMNKAYAGLWNYHQHRQKNPSPPAIEMFLVDRKEVLLSFATPETEAPSVTFGIKLRDEELCEHLETYHRNQLERNIRQERNNER